MTEHLLTKAKAYVALVGSVATALLALYGPDTQIGHYATLALALVTAFGTYRTPNKAPVTPYHEGNAAGNHRGEADAGLLLLVLTFVGVVLLLFRVHF
jgi:hypothetical protein